MARQSAILLAGSAVLAVWSVARLPPLRDLGRAPATPFDRTEARGLAVPTFLFLSRAAAVVPLGATATVVAQPRDPVAETALHPAGVALLPGRRVFPAAQWNAFSPEYELQAEYVLVLGPPPPVPPGRLVLAGPGGTVWRRPTS